MPAIKNIIFDFGGVILNIDYHLSVKAFEALGLRGFESWYSQKSQSALFDLLETGQISPQAFREEIKKRFPEPITDDAIDTAWNALLLDLPEERIHLLQALGKKYRCFLLSNTNDIHIEAFLKEIDRIYSIGLFNSLFEKIYYSSRLGMRKPDKETFVHVLQENNLDPAETVFIDDSPQHIEGAKLAGLHTIYLEKDRTILDLFNENYDLIV